MLVTLHLFPLDVLQLSPQEVRTAQYVRTSGRDRKYVPLAKLQRVLPSSRQFAESVAGFALDACPVTNSFYFVLPRSTSFAQLARTTTNAIRALARYAAR